MNGLSNAFFFGHLSLICSHQLSCYQFHMDGEIILTAAACGQHLNFHDLAEVLWFL